MKLNDMEIKISNYISETLDDEMVLYNEESQKIVILNQPAIFVWKEITASYLENKNICTQDIVNYLLTIYNISEIDISTVVNDVEETIELFFQASLLQND